MSKASTARHLRIRTAAILWWISKRPNGFKTVDHLAFPEAGCTFAERALAKAVADLVRSRLPKQHRGKKT